MKKMKAKDYIYLLVILLLVAAVTVLCLRLSTQTPAQETYYDLKVQAFKMVNMNASAGQIVFVGDSITDGYKLDDFYHQLPLATYNRGISGDTTAGVLGRLQESVFDLSPKKMVLLIGTNDLTWGVSTEEIVENYRKILQQVTDRSPETEVYCVSILPRNNTVEKLTQTQFDAREQELMAINQQIRALAQVFDCHYVDVFSSLADDNQRLKTQYSDDGLHLNEAGYEVWTQIMLPLLEQP